MVQLFTFSHQMPGERIIVGTEPIHFNAFNAALNTENERRLFCCSTLLSDDCENKEREREWREKERDGKNLLCSNSRLFYIASLKESMFANYSYIAYFAFNAACT